MLRWNLTGTPSQIAIATRAFEEIKFPFERLNQLPGIPALNWMDLNPGMPTTLPMAGLHTAETEPPPRHHGDHDHDDGDKPDQLVATLADGRKWVMGQIWTYSGRIDLDIRLEQDPLLAMAVIGAEIAHAVDFFLPMTDDQRNEFLRLWGVGGTWWEVQSYPDEYYRLGGEAFMPEFVGAYMDIPFGNNPFLHDAGVEPEDVRRILGIERTDYVEPAPEPETVAIVRYGKSKVYHRETHRVRAKVAPQYLMDAVGLRPCKVCKP